MFRVMGSVDVPRTGLVVAANLQHFSGKPWAAGAVPLPQGPASGFCLRHADRGGSRRRRCSISVFRGVYAGGVGRIELMLDSSTR